MSYQDRYREYLDLVPERIERCRQTGQRPVLAYTSNLDAIVKWDADSFNRLLDKYLKEEPSFREEESVHNMEDFARIVSYFAINGYGGEVDIESQEVIDTLGQYFEIGYGLGGTCAQGTAALAEMGFPTLVHITDRSQEVIGDWMNADHIWTVNRSGLVPLSEHISGEAPLIHVIMQYTKGDIIKARGTEYEVKLSNRLIMGYDQVHKVMPVESSFLEYCEAHADKIYSYDISGFNAILDMDVMKERLSELSTHYQAVKKKNPECAIYFESAHFISSSIREYTYSVLTEYMHIMGMNEEELVDLTEKMQHQVDKDRIESVIEGLDYLLDIYPVTGIIMHSKDYSLYYGGEMPGVNLEMSLTLGNLMSGTRARIGRYGTWDDCLATLELPLSEIGVEFAGRLKEMALKHQAILVPSRYMEKPKSTIGLGDTFVAGAQIGFVR